MKKLSILGLFIFALISLNSCKTEDDVVFVTDNNSELVFTNSFSAEYVLTPQTSGNLGERFTWESAAVDVPTNVTYQLQKSISGDYTDAETIGATTGNEIAVTIGDMLGFAAQAGLDADPETEEPNTGDVHFRLRSFIGDGGEENFSTSQALTLVLQEATDVVAAVCDNDLVYLIGAGVTFANWSWDTPQILECSGTNVYSGNVAFRSDNDSNWRFFTEATNWDSGQNYPFFADAGYTIDSRFENNNDDDSNFRFTGDNGLYFLTVDLINKVISLDDPTPTGTCDNDLLYAIGFGLTDADWSWDTPVQLMCEGNGVYRGWANFRNEGDANFRFFTEATNWDSGQNYPFFADAGYTIDSNLENANDDDSNFKFVGTTGQYYVVIDTLNKTITLE